MIFSMNKLKLPVLLTLSLFSGLSSASLYFKAFGGNALSTTTYEMTEVTVPNGGSVDSVMPFQVLNTDNLFSFGFGMGFDTNLHPKVKLGFELSASNQLSDTETKLTRASFDSILGDGGFFQVTIRNRIKAVTSMVLTLNKAFFIKAGPSWLRQGVGVEIATEDFLAGNCNTGTGSNCAKHDENDNVNLFGVTVGAGFIYKLSPNFGLYTEYNYSYYPTKSLGNILTAPQVGAIPGQNGHFNDREIKFAQSEFFLGFIYSFFNNDGSYSSRFDDRYKGRGRYRRAPDKCRYEK